MAVDCDVVQHPVVKRTVIFEFQRAQRVRDAFQRIRDAVRVIIHRVDAPLVAGAHVVCAADTVDHRVTQVDIAAGHIDFRAQYTAAIGKLSRAHACE